ncbi:uncharacterized protein LOC106709518 [Papilio machaon]|uniref:uncharacterized protein LOC106709518 n=1 Tax=Papilio machaon TaxID=76193 RepID=UPI001E662FB0|nr:uncharacterized protein LOC106709518 [Papilio machaon]
MSDEENGGSSSARLLSSQYKDDQLEIVEVTSFDKAQLERLDGNVLEVGESSSDGMKYMQVLDSSKNMMVDLLNLTLVRSEDGQESYQLVTNADSSESNEGETVTCVLQTTEDGEETENQETYVMVDGADGPLMFLQQSPIKKPSPLKPAPSPAEILERAKALQKAKKLSSTGGVGASRSRGRGRRRGELPPPHELLASPSFKLFLYSCKLCSFQCNAIKELTAHKAAEHAGGGGSGGGRRRGGWLTSPITLQCARCPYRGSTHWQLMKHVKEKHVEADDDATSNKVYLDSAEVAAADVLVCGACGFESASRQAFKLHIEQDHGANTC